MKEKLISKLKKLRIPNLLSCSIIGSFLSKKEISNVEDVDIYLILKEIDFNTYNIIVDEFNKICKELSNDKTKFLTEFRAGAFKPRFEKGKKKIQLHILINTLDMISSKSPMVALDWRLNNLSISGKNVSNFLKIKKFSKYELVNGKDGLKYFLSLLESNTKAYREWYIEDNKIKRIKKEQKLKSKEDWFGVIQFVVIQGFVNFIRLKEPNFPKAEIKILKMAKTLPKSHYDFLKQVIEIKREFKESGKLDYNINQAKNKAHSFVEYLINQLS
jgi:hypothetical protein